MPSPYVLVVAPDERWLRVLEVTLRVGGFTPVVRRSVVEALRQREGDERPQAIVLDFGTESTAREVEAAREVLGASEIPAVVILPERLGKERDAFRATGVDVIVRPYAPSLLYNAIRPQPEPVPEAVPEATPTEAQPVAPPGPPIRPGPTARSPRRPPIDRRDPFADLRRTLDEG